MAPSRQNVLLAWQLSNYSGWGIAGLNIFMNWCFSGGPRPTMLLPIEHADIGGVDPLRRTLLMPDFARSNLTSHAIQAKLKEGQVSVSCPVVHCLGNNFASRSRNLKGTQNIGRIVFEFPLSNEAIARAKQYDCFVVASKWNQEILQSVVEVPVILNHEGVDYSLFHPAPPSGLLPKGLFYVFSGGKPELRKGQDLVLAAFKRFAENKPDVRLVTAWHSHWMNLSEGLQGCLEHPLRTREGRLDILGWAESNGIHREKIIDVGKIFNSQVAMLIREMDCALQLSRCEGGTNFVAMESIACGVPTLLSETTGHLDIMQNQSVIPISSQPSDPKLNGFYPDWRDADISEVVDVLNMLYMSSKRTDCDVRAATHSIPSWSSHAVRLGEILALHS
jgi:glycosyltransferase involved in cell wall biosynthesis